MHYYEQDFIYNYGLGYRLDAQPKCKPGNKPCGKICIPMKEKCQLKGEGGFGLRQKVGVGLMAGGAGVIAGDAIARRLKARKLQQANNQPQQNVNPAVAKLNRPDNPKINNNPQPSKEEYRSQRAKAEAERIMKARSIENDIKSKDELKRKQDEDWENSDTNKYFRDQEEAERKKEADYQESRKKAQEEDKRRESSMTPEQKAERQKRVEEQVNSNLERSGQPNLAAQREAARIKKEKDERKRLAAEKKSRKFNNKAEKDDYVARTTGKDRRKEYTQKLLIEQEKARNAKKASQQQNQPSSAPVEQQAQDENQPRRTRKRSSARGDSSYSRFDAPKCKASNKPCGKTCIPNKENCTKGSGRFNVGGAAVIAASLGSSALKIRNSIRSKQQLNRMEKQLETVSKMSENTPKIEVDKSGGANVSNAVGETLSSNKSTRKETTSESDREREKWAAETTEGLYGKSKMGKYNAQLNPNPAYNATNQPRKTRRTRKRSSARGDSSYSRFDAPKCKAGNKPCGKACVPNKYKCNPKLSKAVNVGAAGVLAGAAGLGGYAIKRSSDNRRKKVNEYTAKLREQNKKDLDNLDNQLNQALANDKKRQKEIVDNATKGASGERVPPKWQKEFDQDMEDWKNGKQVHFKF